MRAAQWANLSARVEMTLVAYGRGKAAGGYRASPGHWRIIRRVWPGGAMQAAHGANQTGAQGAPGHTGRGTGDSGGGAGCTRVVNRSSPGRGC